MTVVIKELDKVPAGRFGLLKRLTKTTDGNGKAVYSIREYAPRPVFRNKGEEPEEYVPARGVDLTADDLKDICRALRLNLHEARTYDAEAAEAAIKAFEKDPDSFPHEENNPCPAADISEEERMNNDDPCPEYDYTEELGIEIFMPLWFGEKANGKRTELNLVSFHNAPIVYDLRVYTDKINSRGYIEPTPEIDKGISFDDFEAEELCRGIEILFPSLSAEFSEYRGDDPKKGSNKIDFGFSAKRRQAAVKAVDFVMKTDLSRRLTQSAHGSEIGDMDREKVFEYMCALRRKTSVGEPLYDTEAHMLSSVIYRAVGEADYDTDFKHILLDTADMIDTEVLARKRLPGYQYQCRQLKHLTASAGELGVLTEVLTLLYKNLYGPPEEVKDKFALRNHIDNLATDDIEIRNKDRVSMPDGYREEPGRRFLEDWISAAKNSSESPLGNFPWQ